MSMRSIFILLINLLLFKCLSAQIDTAKSIRYSPDYKFKDGVYVSFDQVKMNSPIPANMMITDYNPEELDFFKNVVKDEVIVFFDDYGVKREVKTTDIWGYSRMGTLYINLNDEFNRIPVVGRICHFVADVTVYRQGFSNSFYNPYYYSSYSPTYSTREMRQYILDFETGKVMDYNTQSLSVVLMRDTQLYEEFNILKKRKQRQMKFFFLRKFNERNPLFLPKK